jgi:signal transduction histidine kinase
LMKDAVRLQLQLENSLYYAQREGQLYVESISMADLVRRVTVDWPELEVRVAGDARVRADERALIAVLRNVLQNAVVHGGARSVSVQIERAASGQVTTTFADDGRGAPADVIRSLGRPLARAAAFHGSGVGLLISQHLLGRMRGAARFGPAARRGLTVTIDLPEAG